MSQSQFEFLVQNLAIVVAAKNHNPTVLNPDFLKHNHIVPENWELAAPSVCIDPVATVSFLSGVTIVAQLDRISFAETITEKPVNSVAISAIASKYIQTLRHVNYRAVGINPSGFVTVSEERGVARDFIVKKLFSPSFLSCLPAHPESGGVKLLLPADGWKLTVSIEEGFAQPPGKPPAPVVAFEGNYHRELVGSTVDERLKQLDDCLKEWPKLVENFRDVVTRILST